MSYLPLDLFIPTYVKLTANILPAKTCSDIMQASWATRLHAGKVLTECGWEGQRRDEVGSWGAMFRARAFSLVPPTYLPRKCNFPASLSVYESRKAHLVHSSLRFYSH